MTDTPEYTHTYAAIRSQAQDIGEGWSQATIIVKPGETAWNPGSTKRPIYGAAKVTYQFVAPSGSVHGYEDYAPVRFTKQVGATDGQEDTRFNDHIVKVGDEGVWYTYHWSEDDEFEDWYICRINHPDEEGQYMYVPVHKSQIEFITE
jgi:hypothetical protein